MTPDQPGPVAEWLAKEKAEREAAEAERRRRAERAAAIAADLAKVRQGRA